MNSHLDRNDYITLEDGYVYFWTEQGAYSATDLRELDRRKKK